MKRLKSVLAISFALMIGLLVGARLFLPWEELIEVTFLRGTAKVQAEAVGYFVQGTIPTMGVKGLELKAPMGSIRINSLKATPLIIKSITNLAPTVRLELERAIAGVGGTETTFGGVIVLSMGRGALSIKDLKLQGGLEARGKMDISLETSRITQADVAIKAPQELSGVLSAASTMMPLTQGADGVWNLKREEGQ